MLVGVGVVLAAVVGVAPAGATSCAQSTVAEQVGRADAVFVGTTSPSGADEDAVLVEVSDVYKGDVPRTAPVVAEPDMGQPQVFASDQQYVFFVQDEDGALVSGVCSGTGPVDDAVLSDLEAATSDRAAYRPAPVAPTPSAAAPEPAAPTASAAGEGTGGTDAASIDAESQQVDSPSPVVVGLIVAAVVLVVVVGPLYVRRRSRREGVGPTT
ncbi:hypothetical protein [Mumia sp. DW29H23]|uniref:hypothetical protein n=1 Tax=Mumia sp. DW29H23 TaxID=3421241 RepID=UPI003D686743